MKWYHKCSLEWLRERQEHLTATDIYKLIPETKTGRERKVTKEDYLKVYFDKLQRLTEDDCISTGAAARGHLLEPYAVDKYIEGTGHQMYHWDDEIVYNKDGNLFYGIAFSPDACDISRVDWRDKKEIRAILEIKSYGNDKHFSYLNAKKDKLEERWQIATAMTACPSISKGTLCLYNPRVSYFQMLCFEYKRGDLTKEIQTIREIHDKFVVYVNEFVSDQFYGRLNTNCFTLYGSDKDEELIMEDIEKKQGLNP